MYLPSHFAEHRTEVLHATMLEHPFATLARNGADGPAADHLPLLLDAKRGALGTLRGHVARANPLWQAAPVDVLAIFHGPQAYVTPSWYPTKREHGKAVPTWNYVVVHARGPLRAIDDTDWKRAMLDELTAIHEAGFADPWRIADAPADYVDKMLAAVVGIEIEIASLQGKFKLSQNQPAGNRAGVVSGLRQRGEDAGLRVADLLSDDAR